ncbi:MAG: class D sortase [Ruminococcus sp.]|nr:class D sortase [Ruminococcus sp.]
MKKSSLLPKLIMPFLVTAFCGGVLFLISIKPYEKAQTYLKVSFMDNNTVIPQSEGIAGLNIVQTDIDTEYSGSTYEKGDIIYPEYGTQYAVIECEAADIFAPVYWGNGSELLELGGCNTPSSVPAGGEGNTVISAHVNTFFANLNKVKAGDEVKIYTDYGRFTYKVSKLIEFESTDKKYLKKGDKQILTLYTCERDLLASSTKRIGCICELTKSEYYTEPREVAADEE